MIDEVKNNQKSIFQFRQLWQIHKNVPINYEDKGQITLIVNIKTAKGSIYQGGTITIDSKTLLHRVGQMARIEVAKCLDPSAYCMIKINNMSRDNLIKPTINYEDTKTAFHHLSVAPDPNRSHKLFDYGKNAYHTYFSDDRSAQNIKNQIQHANHYTTKKLARTIDMHSVGLSIKQFDQYGIPMNSIENHEIQNCKNKSCSYQNKIRSIMAEDYNIPLRLNQHINSSKLVQDNLKESSVNKISIPLKQPSCQSCKTLAFQLSQSRIKIQSYQKKLSILQLSQSYLSQQQRIKLTPIQKLQQKLKQSLNQNFKYSEQLSKLKLDNHRLNQLLGDQSKTLWNQQNSFNFLLENMKSKETQYLKLYEEKLILLKADIKTLRNQLIQKQEVISQKQLDCIKLKKEISKIPFLQLSLVQIKQKNLALEGEFISLTVIKDLEISDLASQIKRNTVVLEQNQNLQIVISRQKQQLKGINGQIVRLKRQNEALLLQKSKLIQESSRFHQISQQLKDQNIFLTEQLNTCAKKEQTQNIRQAEDLLNNIQNIKLIQQNLQISQLRQQLQSYARKCQEYEKRLEEKTSFPLMESLTSKNEPKTVDFIHTSSITSLESGSHFHNFFNKESETDEQNKHIIKENGPINELIESSTDQDIKIPIYQLKNQLIILRQQNQTLKKTLQQAQQKLKININSPGSNKINLGSSHQQNQVKHQISSSYCSEQFIPLQLQSLKLEIYKLSKQLKISKQSLQLLQSEKSHFQFELNEEKLKSNKITNQLRQKEMKLQHIKYQLEQLKDNTSISQSKWQQERNQFQGQISALILQVQEIRTEKDKEIREMIKKATETQTKLDDNHYKQMEKMKKQEKNIKQALGQSNKQRQKIQLQKQNLSKQLSKQRQQHLKKQIELERISVQNCQLSCQIENLSKKLVFLNQKQSSQKQAQKLAQQQLKNLEQQIQNHQQHFKHLKQKIKSELKIYLSKRNQDEDFAVKLGLTLKKGFKQIQKIFPQNIIRKVNVFDKKIGNSSNSSSIPQFSIGLSPNDQQICTFFKLSALNQNKLQTQNALCPKITTQLQQQNEKATEQSISSILHNPDQQPLSPSKIFGSSGLIFNSQELNFKKSDIIQQFRPNQFQRDAQSSNALIDNSFGNNNQILKTQPKPNLQQQNCLKSAQNHLDKFLAQNFQKSSIMENNSQMDKSSCNAKNSNDNLSKQSSNFTSLLEIFNELHHIKQNQMILQGEQSSMNFQKIKLFSSSNSQFTSKHLDFFFSILLQLISQLVKEYLTLQVQNSDYQNQLKSQLQAISCLENQLSSIQAQFQDYINNIEAKIYRNQVEYHEKQKQFIDGIIQENQILKSQVQKIDDIVQEQIDKQRNINSKVVSQLRKQLNSMQSRLLNLQQQLSIKISQLDELSYQFCQKQSHFLVQKRLSADKLAKSNDYMMNLQSQLKQIQQQIERNKQQYQGLMEISEQQKLFLKEKLEETKFYLSEQTQKRQQIERILFIQKQSSSQAGFQKDLKGDQFPDQSSILSARSFIHKSPENPIFFAQNQCKESKNNQSQAQNPAEYRNAELIMDDYFQKTQKRLKNSRQQMLSSSFFKTFPQPSSLELKKTQSAFINYQQYQQFEQFQNSFIDKQSV